MAIFFSPWNPSFKIDPWGSGAFEKRQSLWFQLFWDWNWSLCWEMPSSRVRAPRSRSATSSSSLQSQAGSGQCQLGTWHSLCGHSGHSEVLRASLNDSSYLSASDAGASTELQLLQPCLINLKTPFFFSDLNIRAQSSRGRCKDWMTKRFLEK